MSRFLTYSKIENGQFISIQVNEQGQAKLDIERSRGRDRHEKYLAPYTVNELFTQFERSGWVHMQHMGAGLISLGAGIEGNKPQTKSVDSFFLSGELQTYVDMFEGILVDMREEMSWRNADRRFHSIEPEPEEDVNLGWLVAPVLGAMGIIAAQVILILALLALGIGAYSATENLMVVFPLLIVGLVGGLATYVGSGMALGYWCRVDAVHKGMAAAGLVGFINIMSALYMGSFGFTTLSGIGIAIALTRAGVSGGMRLRNRKRNL